MPEPFYFFGFQLYGCLANVSDTRSEFSTTVESISIHQRLGEDVALKIFKVGTSDITNRTVRDKKFVSSVLGLVSRTFFIKVS